MPRTDGGFRVTATKAGRLASRKRRIERRLAPTDLGDCNRPAFTARNIRYEVADSGRGFVHGGIGVIHALARRVGLIDAIDDCLNSHTQQEFAAVDLLRA
jgi:hypothetical protein